MAAALADRFAPPALVAGSDGSIVFYHGDVQRYLRPQAGEATQNLMALAQDGLAPHIRRALAAAAQSGKPESARTIGDLDAGERALLIEAAPVPGLEDRFLISFVEERAPPPHRNIGASECSSRELELAEEVRVLRAELASTTWSANQSLEETRAYGEEVTSMNEELRAANEELETSKEELQSLNEELRTRNAQLRSTVSDLRERTSDLDNLLRSTNIATLFLGADLSVRWFSPTLVDLFRIREEDIGRPVGDLVRRFDDPSLEEECRRVLDTLERREAPAEGEEGRTFLRRITPYRDEDDRIAGLDLTFAVPEPLLVLDTKLRVTSANPAFYATFHVDAAQTLDRLIYDLGNGQWNIPELRRLLEEVLPHDDMFHDFEVTHELPGVGSKTMLLSGRRLDHVQLILLVLVDITERRALEAQQALLMGELGHRVKNALAVVQGLAKQTAHRSRSLGEFLEAFSGRLSAYSHAHSRLLSWDWRPGPLGETVMDAIDSHAVDPQRFTIDGPDVPLSAEQALALGLVLHELETNATKHGAFSDGAGRVSVSWEVRDKKIHLRWQERGGPQPTQISEEGFGSTLIRQLVGFQMGGDVDLALAPEGARCEISFPLDLSGRRPIRRG